MLIVEKGLILGRELIFKFEACLRLALFPLYKKKKIKFVSRLKKLGVSRKGKNVFHLTFRHVRSLTAVQFCPKGIPQSNLGEGALPQFSLHFLYQKTGGTEARSRAAHAVLNEGEAPSTAGRRPRSAELKNWRRYLLFSFFSLSKHCCPGLS